MADMVPAVIAWVERVRELRTQGVAVTVFEIHDCLGIILPVGYRRRPELRYCDCPGVEAWHTTVEAVFSAHGLEAVAGGMHNSTEMRTRYGW